MKQKGFVYLLGAGPGRPDLITVRGLTVLKKAEVLIYDNLCNPYLLRHVPESSRKIYVGKHSGLHTLSQRRIEDLMVRHAKAGRLVVRLKGGDPFLFGRGAEEAAVLKKKGIPFEVIPGVTSAFAVPAYAGIPATHRDHASAVAVLTGHEDDGKGQSRIDMNVVAQFPGTLIFLMGVKRLEELVRQLIAGGKSDKTPIALVRWGTRGLQETISGKLSTIVTQARRYHFRPPAVIIIGDVVQCRPAVKWFERKPLLGRRIIITRSQIQSEKWSTALIDLGAEVIELPTIELIPHRTQADQRKLVHIRKWDWVILTSPTSAEYWVKRVLEIHHDLRILSGIRIVSIGEQTAGKLSEFGLKPEVTSSVSHSGGLIRTLSKYEWHGQKVLFPGSDLARDLVEKELIRRGARTGRVVLYRNRPPRSTWVLTHLDRLGADTITFASSSAAKNLHHLLQSTRGPYRSLRKLLSQCKRVSIGPETSKTLRELGYRVDAEASKPNIQEMIRALQSIRIPMRSHLKLESKIPTV